MNKKHTPKHLYCQIFRENFYISYGISVKKFEDSIKRIIGNGYTADIDKHNLGKFIVFETKKTRIIWIWTKEKDIGAISHECLHAIRYCLQRKGIDLNAETEEIYCYMLEWMMDNIVKKRK